LTVHSAIPLFRPEVAAARQGRLHGDISLAIPVSWQVIGYLLFAALAAAAAFLMLASYSRVETVGGAIVMDKGTVAIVPTRAGVVATLHVTEGSHVVAGQSLAQIRAEEDLSGGSTAPQRVLDSLSQQDRQLGNQAALVLDAANAERSRLNVSIAGAQSEIAGIDAQIADQRQLVALAQRDFAQAQGLVGKGFISRRDIDAREVSLLSRRQQLAQLIQSKSAKATTLADLQRSMAQSLATAQAQAAAVQSQRSQLAQQIAQFDAAKGYRLTSPVSGSVTALTARIGQPVAQGQQLMVVVPDGGRVGVELHVPTNAVGFLRAGQKVRLAVDAFPYERFGTVDAHITDISTTAITKQIPNGAVPVYLVKAALSRDTVDAFGTRRPLRSGMTLNARIVTRRQSLFEWLFEPLFAVGRR